MSKALDMTSVIEQEADKAVLCQTAGIKRASAQKRKEDKETMLRTEGLNIQANNFCLHRYLVMLLLADNIPACLAFRCQIDTSLGHLPSKNWKRCPGHPRNGWLDLVWQHS